MVCARTAAINDCAAAAAEPVFYITKSARASKESQVHMKYGHDATVLSLLLLSLYHLLNKSSEDVHLVLIFVYSTFPIVRCLFSSLLKKDLRVITLLPSRTKDSQRH